MKKVLFQEVLKSSGIHAIAFDQRAVIYPSPDHHSDTLLAKMATRVPSLSRRSLESATPLTVTVEKPSPIVRDVQKRPALPALCRLLLVRLAAWEKPRWQRE
jgi:hypothetical protein